MNPPYNVYSSSAHLYDLNPGYARSADLDFYLHWARKTEGQILELACGTGRLTIPIAQAGYRIHGLDLSSAMLDVFSQKMSVLEPAVAARIALHQGDMSAFELGQVFGLIFVPFRSFQSLATRDAQASCLSAVRRHLSQDGVFIVDVFKPYAHLDASWESPIQEDWTVDDPQTGRRVKRSHVRKKIDPQAQIIEVDYVFEISERGRVIQEIIDPLRLAYLYEEQMDRLLAACGFEIIHKWGDYDGRPVGEGGELIYACHRK